MLKKRFKETAIERKMQKMVFADLVFFIMSDIKTNINVINVHGN